MERSSCVLATAHTKWIYAKERDVPSPFQKNHFCTLWSVQLLKGLHYCPEVKTKKLSDEESLPKFRLPAITTHVFANYEKHIYPEQCFKNRNTSKAN